MNYPLIALIIIVSIFLIIFLVVSSCDSKLNKRIQDDLDFERRLRKGKVSFLSKFKGFLRPKYETKFHHKEILKVLLNLDEKSLEQLFSFYKNEFGKGAERYARKTHLKWRSGKVQPIRQTFERFMVHLPKVMDYDLKCEVLRHLMQEYCAKDRYELEVFTDDWERTLEPLVRKIVDKPYTANLPPEVERQLKWLAEDEMQIAESILKKSQVEEGKIAVSMLKKEFASIENLLENMNGKPRVTHEMKFPYGTIELKIKKR